MAKVVEIRCTACSGRVFLVRERAPYNDWLFEKLEALGHRLYTRRETPTCPGCGALIGRLAFPEGTEDDHWEALERRALTVTQDEPFPPVSDRTA